MQPISRPLAIAFLRALLSFVVGRCTAWRYQIVPVSHYDQAPFAVRPNLSNFVWPAIFVPFFDANATENRAVEAPAMISKDLLEPRRPN